MTYIWQELWIGIIMGTVEGLTEFAPVSSTGHLILVGQLISFHGTVRASFFEVFIQLGSILAVITIFWRRILHLLGINKQKKHGENQLNLLHIFLACLPAVIMGALFHHYIKTYLFTATTVVIGLIAGGILMILAERRKTPVRSRNLDEITYKQALGIGLFQCLALWPGFSRSGSTISGGLIFGCSHKTASEISFLIAVPMMFGATAKDLYESWNYLSLTDLPLFISGFITAFVVSLLCIHFFLRLIEKVKLTPFAIYRFVLAIAYSLFFIW